MKPVTLDVFEFGVLIEAAWHSGTILRYSIMQRAIDNWYCLLTPEEVARTFEFFNRTQGADAKQDIQKRFLARYNPANQFTVNVNYKGKEEVKQAYLYAGEYWVDSMRRISKEYIVLSHPNFQEGVMDTLPEIPKAKVIDRNIIHALKQRMFDEYDVVAELKFSQTEQGIVYIDCNIPPAYNYALEVFDAEIKDLQRRVIGVEFISEFYTEETGHWKIFLKGC